MKFISTNNAPQAIGPYSQAVEANGMIYTSGQIGLTPEGTFAAQDVAGQTHQVMRNLTAVFVVISIDCFCCYNILYDFIIFKLCGVYSSTLLIGFTKLPHSLH